MPFTLLYPCYFLIVSSPAYFFLFFLILSCLVFVFVFLCLFCLTIEVILCSFGTRYITRTLISVTQHQSIHSMGRHGQNHSYFYFITFIGCILFFLFSFLALLMNYIFDMIRYSLWQNLKLSKNVGIHVCWRNQKNVAITLLIF